MQVEFKTKEQAQSKLWYQMRAGRITVSHFKSACQTNSAQPSISLIIAICHPEMSKFKSVVTNWECEHEKVAISKYLSIMMKQHHQQGMWLFYSYKSPIYWCITRWSD